MQGAGYEEPRQRNVSVLVSEVVGVYDCVVLNLINLVVRYLSIGQTNNTKFSSNTILILVCTLYAGHARRQLYSHA